LGKITTIPFKILILHFLCAQKSEGANGVVVSGDRKRTTSSSLGSAAAGTKKEEKKKTNDEAKSTAQFVSELSKNQVR
jgi:hypothetical protein